MLAPERRLLYMRISRAEPVALNPELPVRAYASAQRTLAGGKLVRVSLLSLDGEPEATRRLLDRHSGVVLSWDRRAEACGPDDCPLNARFLDPHTVRIDRGAWPTSLRPGVEQHCQRRQLEVDGLLELSVSRSRRSALGGLMGLPLRSTTSVQVTSTGVRVTRSDLMPSIEAAERAAAEPVLADLLVSPVGALGTNLRRERIDSELRTDFDVLWEDLELARQDDARQRAAERYAQALQHIRPGDEVDVTRRDAVMAQIGLRLDAIESASPGRKKELALELAELLARARAHHPQDEGLAFIECELLLGELRDAKAARKLSERFIRDGRGDRFRRLRREAAARIGVAELSAALRADGLAGRRAKQIASDIVALVERGERYPDAERAVLGTARLQRAR